MQQQDLELYARGKYRLAYDRKRDGTLRSPYLQIVWYDAGHYSAILHLPDGLHRVSEFFRQ